jgi:threonyl-tRNA synthetase
MSGKLTITLPDGATREYKAGVTGLEIAESISAGLARNALAVRVDGQVLELNRPIHHNATVGILTWNDPDGKATFWHSSAHILAEALERHYPGIKLGIGPAIETGFYYDIDFNGHTFSQEDFETIEKTFLELAKSGETFVRKEVSKADAVAYFTEKQDHLKLDLLKDLEDGTITFYESGNFVDLCRGPHIPNSSVIKAVKLLTIAGAYWRGKSENQMLTRIYAVSYPSKKELDEYLFQLEEARKRDHRKLGRELDMFSFHEEGPGFPFWHNNGMIVLNELQTWLRRKLYSYGYQEIKTPVILNEQLWLQSGHYENYKENMYFTDIDETNYAVKPMNCPGSTLVYRTGQHSYRDLPLRLFEFGLVHRHEISGALHGLFRVRAFTQDDAHIFCTPDQVEAEVMTLIDLVFSVYRTFDFNDVKVKLSTRPDNYIGSLEIWNLSERALEDALRKAGIQFQLNPGDGAFYGPKIDFVVRDSLKREWQLGTIQLDFSMPHRFGLEYIASDGSTQRPVMIHRAIFGSFERFFGVLLEHYAGNLPAWLSPVQVSVLPISEKFTDYANNVVNRLLTLGIRAQADHRNEKITRKIRDAEVRKIPFMCVVGEKEAQAGTVALRKHGEGDTGTFTITDTAERIRQAIAV